MRLIYLISLLSMFSSGANAQQRMKGIYVELSGPGGFLSANYDARFGTANKGLGFRAGIGTLFDTYNFGFTLPVGLNYLAGGESNFFEVDGGASFFHFKETNQDSWFNFKKTNFLTPFIWVGYRHQPVEKKFMFRAGLCQFLTDLNIPAVLGIPSLYPSISFGYSLP